MKAIKYILIFLVFVSYFTNASAFVSVSNAVEDNSSIHCMDTNESMSEMTHDMSSKSCQKHCTANIMNFLESNVSILKLEIYADVNSTRKNLTSVDLSTSSPPPRIIIA